MDSAVLLRGLAKVWNFCGMRSLEGQQDQGFPLKIHLKLGTVFLTEIQNFCQDSSPINQFKVLVSLW